MYSSVSAARERGRYSSTTSPLHPSCDARAPNGSASRSTAAARWTCSSSAQTASSRSHVDSVASDARPERMRPSSALRWASTREYCRRVSARNGQIAATTWSRCALRTAGGPLTRSSRSGRNTLTSGRVSTSSRRSTGAPSAVMRLTGCAPSPSEPNATVSSWLSAPSASRTVTRAACAPKRTSSRSLRVRGERAVHP